MKITRFEDIEAWQEARKLVKFEKIYALAEKVSKLDSGFIKYLISQLKQPNKPK